MNTMLSLSVVVYRHLILAIDVILFFLKVNKYSFQVKINMYSYKEKLTHFITKNCTTWKTTRTCMDGKNNVKYLKFAKDRIKVVFL